MTIQDPRTKPSIKTLISIVNSKSFDSKGINFEALNFKSKDLKPLIQKHLIKIRQFKIQGQKPSINTSI